MDRFVVRKPKGKIKSSDAHKNEEHERDGGEKAVAKSNQRDQGPGLTQDQDGRSHSPHGSSDDIQRTSTHTSHYSLKRESCCREAADEDNSNTLKRKRTDGFLMKSLKKRKILGENLNCDYMKVYEVVRNEADDLLKQCEDRLDYFTGDLARIQVYGKWHDIRRKQVAHGDSGVTYKYSGVTVPAKPWTPLLSTIRDRIQEVTGHTFNFVLINRYANGSDYMGEHRDDEKDLVATSPIASLSLGQHRDFVFRHCEARGSHAKRNIAPVKLELEHGSLLVMNYPTNVYWYHSLPVRKRALHVRINMTFRDIHVADKK
ncbi:LOW QUALITY PROTEIN: DNA oxidative demethylase ALKBH2-like [Diadema setosum]|uniref:LOW QUALITY PROTEIN: DNA oxidative demethylase ALKBH2-like n=1 Tax=Diadema setosum TaxID=31175 RepID=UPI003B3B89B1